MFEEEKETKIISLNNVRQNFGESEGKSKKVEEKTQRTEEKVQKTEEKVQNSEEKTAKEKVTELAKVEETEKPVAVTVLLAVLCADIDTAVCRAFRVLRMQNVIGENGNAETPIFQELLNKT